MRIFVLITLILACSVTAASQALSSQTRAQQLAASFNKFKSLSKEKHGVTKEKYKDVHSEPVVNQNIGDYSGVYEVSYLSFGIKLQVESAGQIQGSGYEPAGEDNQQRTFRLEQARITEGLLTATKVYANGATEKFEGVFINRTERNSPNDTGVTAFGLGVLLSTPREHGGITYDKLFYERK